MYVRCVVCVHVCMRNVLFSVSLSLFPSLSLSLCARSARPSLSLCARSARPSLSLCARSARPSVTGAGFSNIMFCAPGTTVIEFGFYRPDVPLHRKRFDNMYFKVRCTVRKVNNMYFKVRCTVGKSIICILR